MFPIRTGLRVNYGPNALILRRGLVIMIYLMISYLRFSGYSEKYAHSCINKGIGVSPASFRTPCPSRSCPMSLLVLFCRSYQHK